MLSLKAFQCLVSFSFYYILKLNVFISHYTTFSVYTVPVFENAMSSCTNKQKTLATMSSGHNLDMVLCAVNLLNR